MSIKQRPPSSALQTGWLGLLAAPLLALASQTATQFVRRPGVPSLALRAGVATEFDALISNAVLEFVGELEFVGQGRSFRSFSFDVQVDAATAILVG